MTYSYANIPNHMAMNYKEAPRGTAKAQLEQYAEGISEVSKLVERLYSEGLLPERFAPEPSRLHPSLEGKVSIVPLMMGGESGPELLTQLTPRVYDIDSDARHMAESRGFTPLAERVQVDIVIARIRDLTSKPYVTTAELIGTEKDRDSQGNSAPFTKGIMTEKGLFLLPPPKLPPVILLKNVIILRLEIHFGL